MTSKKLLLAGLVAALGLAGSVQAATVTITPSITGVLNKGDFSPVDPALILGPGLLAPRAEPYLLQVDVTVTTTGLPDDASGFANTAFNTTIHGDGTASDGGIGIKYWSGDSSQFDVTGPGGPTVLVNKWAANSDEGSNKNDLNGVILENITKDFGSAQWDIRRNLTEGAGDFAGSFYIELPGTPGATTSATILAEFGASTYDASGNGSTAGNTATGGSTSVYTVQPIPEPSTLALLGLGSVLLAFARKRR